jgi:glycosyltransferase involved in cell wall biosynthesis
MDFVTISDHNCIKGALEIADLPGTFISVEVTTYFPENGCKVHVLATGIDEEQFRMIQELRADIYQLHKYFMDEDIICTVAHPFYRVNARLTIDQVEKLILMFPRFEEINGTRDRRGAELAAAVFRNLTPEMIGEMSRRHGIEPHGPEAWRKSFTAGSDDHSGAYTASAYTVTPFAEDVAEFLAHLRRGEHEAAGTFGGSVTMGHGLYHIAYGYYKDRVLRGNQRNGSPTILGELFKRLLEARPEEPSSGLGSSIRGMATRVLWSRQVNKLNDMERLLIDDFSRLFSERETLDRAQPVMDDRRTFHIACQISHTLGFGFFDRFVQFVRKGRLMESLQTVASLAPVAMSMAPYLAAFSTQHKDELFHKALTSHFPTAAHLRQPSRRKAWITDTFAEVNGVSRTIQTLAETARFTGRQLTVLTSLVTPPVTKADVKNFPPVGTFPMPEYPSQTLAFPPFLEIIEYIERNRFNELIISTPGPMGLTGLLAARLLGLRTTGIYHTDFVQYVRHLTQDDDLADLTWKYMFWFYEQTTSILAPTECYRKQLMHHGFDPTKLGVMARGVDTRLFHPDKRDPAFYDRFGMNGSFRFLYVGRISREKNLDNLLDAFDDVLRRGHKASLALVGEGPYREQLQARCQGKLVAFTGLLEGEDLARAYASADAMIFPSTTDTFGNVVLEAQAAGVPVVVTDVGGPAEIVRRHNSGLIVQAAQPGLLADAMESLYLSESRCNELRALGLRNAGECKWEQVLDGFWSRDEEDNSEVDRTAFRNADPSIAAGVIAMDLA